MIGVVVVTYNSEKDIEKCLASVFQQGCEVEVVVVDNASEDGTVGVLRGKFPQVKLIQNEENVGFAKAVNQGERFLQQGRNINSTDFLLLMNPDAVLEEGALEEMLKVMEEQECAVVQPVIMKMSKPEEVMTCGNEYRGMGLVMRNTSSRAVRRRQISYASGTCLLLRSDVWEEMGGFDESYFLYYEDTEFSHRLRQKGHQIWLADKARVRHADHSRFTMKRLIPYAQGWLKFSRGLVASRWSAGS